MVVVLMVGSQRWKRRHYVCGSGGAPPAARGGGIAGIAELDHPSILGMGQQIYICLLYKGYVYKRNVPNILFVSQGVDTFFLSPLLLLVSLQIE